jgi:xanthine dehydrogenase accessory factor
MAFADAVFDGAAILDGLTALRVDTSAELRDALAAREVVPVAVVPFSQALGAADWSAVIDARMRKRAVPVTTARDGAAHNRSRPEFRCWRDGRSRN